MTEELKTLKEIDLFPDDKSSENKFKNIEVKFELSKEVIKWIKFYISEAEKPVSEVYRDYLIAKATALREFFNIQERDLL